jgi:glycosyltransferase involved in cell wall biosynthesis
MVSQTVNVTPLNPTNYPAIEAIGDSPTRPLWSVMIPTYNGDRYLEKTLRSVLDQDPGDHVMQIEVIDDRSSQESPEALVDRVGQGRVSFFQNPTNLGLIGNWNQCIQRAKGQWVHILHQDDIVLPGFYQQLQAATPSSSSVGAAFSRFTFMDEDDLWHGLSHIERRTPGVLEHWLEKIAVVQLIQFPAMVVRRSVYEHLGGFCADVHYAADWEMWKRIAAHYEVWFEPQVLACYRQHSGSETSRMVSLGLDIADIRKAIAMSESYLPGEKAEELSERAREHYALYALRTARRMLSNNDTTAAIAQITEAFRCSRSMPIVRSALPLLKSVTKRWAIQQYTNISKS